MISLQKRKCYVPLVYSSKELLFVLGLQTQYYNSNKSCKTTITLNLTQLPISEKSQPTKRVSNKTLGLVLRLLHMVVSRANYFWKMGGHPKSEAFK